MFSKKPREHVGSAPPLSLCVGHFGELREDGGYRRKAAFILIVVVVTHMYVFVKTHRTVH